MPTTSPKSSMKAASAQAIHDKTSKIAELPDDIAKLVLTALPLKDKAALARISRDYHGLFSQYLKTAKLLMLVAHGEEEPAAQMLASNADLLLNHAEVTDYSGRTFKHITAYEYAYWAKDTHMCRMLEHHMDEKTKKAMLEKVTAIDTVGLTYEQHGHAVKHSNHFDMTPLKTALENFFNGYDGWNEANNSAAIHAAWMDVGLTQRELPVHVINEYCRPDRSFQPLPAFKEDTLPRILTYYNSHTDLDLPFFPLTVSDTSGPGVNHALQRREGRLHATFSLPDNSGNVTRLSAFLDLEAVRKLDTVRSDDLKQSLINLGWVEPELDQGAQLSL